MELAGFSKYPATLILTANHSKSKHHIGLANFLENLRHSAQAVP